MYQKTDLDIFSNLLLSALEDESQVGCGDVFQFRTPKKSGKMAQLASESRTPKSILKTPVVKDGTPRKCRSDASR